MQLEHTKQKEEVIDGKTLVGKTSVNPTFYLFFFFMCSVNLFYTVTLVVIVVFFFFLRGCWLQDKISIADTIKCQIRLTVLNLCKRLIVL